MPKAKVGELELHYELDGDEGNPTVLMIMGLGAQLVQWPEGYWAGLVERGFRVLRFDNRDVGQSSRLDQLGVPNLRRQMARWAVGLPVHRIYGLEEMADDAAGLLDALDIPRAHVMGVSMGGMISQLVAVRHPHRVASLTSIMSHPGDRLSSIPRPRALRALLQPLPRTRELAQDASVRFFRAVGSTGFAQDEDGIRHRAGLHYDRGQSPRGFMRQMAAILAARDRRPALQRLDKPALVVHGTIDPLIPPRGGLQTSGALRGSRLLRIPGMGHDLPEPTWPEIFDAFEQVVEQGERRR